MPPVEDYHAKIQSGMIEYIKTKQMNDNAA